MATTPSFYVSPAKLGRELTAFYGDPGERARALASRAREAGARALTVDASRSSLPAAPELAAAWQEGKDGTDTVVRRSRENVEKDIARLFGFRQVSIRSAGGTLEAALDGDVVPAGSLDAVRHAAFISLVAASVRRPSFVFVENPEFGFNPPQAADYLLSLATYAFDGLVYASASSYLTWAYADAVRRPDGKFVAPGERTPWPAALEGAGFANALLVYDAADVKAYHLLLRKIGEDHSTAVLPVADCHPEELRDLVAAGIRALAVFDSLKDAPKNPAKAERQALKDRCDRFGIPALLTERRALKNYFDETAVRAIKGPSAKPLEPYEALKADRWARAENWRLVTETPWESFAATDIGLFLENQLKTESAL